MRFLLASIFLIFAAGAANAGPLVFNYDDDAGTVMGGTFNGSAAEGGLTEFVPELNAALSVELVSVGSGGNGDNTVWTFKFTLDNTSTINSRITALVFDTTPNFDVDESGISVVGAVIDEFSGAGSLPQSFGNFEGCASANGDPCQGGGGDGIDEGGSDMWTITFVTSAPTETFSFDDFGVRYQGVDFNCGGQGGQTGGDCASGVGYFEMTMIPEPATWMMMILGFGMIGLQMQRRRKLEVSLS